MPYIKPPNDAAFQRTHQLALFTAPWPAIYVLFEALQPGSIFPHYMLPVLLGLVSLLGYIAGFIFFHLIYQALDR